MSISNREVIVQSPTYTFKYLIIGDSDVGKTSMLLTYTKGFFDSKVRPTVGIDFFVKTDTINDDIVKNQFWDTSGQEKFKTIMNSYYRNSISCIVVYDVTNRCSFSNVEYWMQELSEHVDIQNVSLLLVGNKSDLKDLRQVPIEEGATVANRYNAMFLETSALNNSNIHEVFNKLAHDVYSKQKKVDERALSKIKLDSIAQGGSIRRCKCSC
jgi:small GTP-binding protein